MYIASAGSDIKWIECLLIKGMDYRVQMFDLILSKSVGLWASIQSVGKWVSDNFESLLQQRKTTCLLSIPNKNTNCNILI